MFKNKGPKLSLSSHFNLSQKSIDKLKDTLKTNLGQSPENTNTDKIKDAFRKYLPSIKGDTRPSVYAENLIKLHNRSQKHIPILNPIEKLDELSLTKKESIPTKIM